MAVSPVRLNHAVLFVTDLNRAVRFYTNVFGMNLIGHEPAVGAAFLRLPNSGNHHDLGLFGIDGAARPPRRSVGLYHLAWQLDTIDQLVEFREVLLAAGAYTGQSSHGATKSIYGADPDGNEFEIMWMLPRAEWGAYESSAVVERLDLATEFEKWSGTRTAGELVHATPGTAAQPIDTVPTKEH